MHEHSQKFVIRSRSKFVSAYPSRYGEIGGWREWQHPCSLKFDHMTELAL